MRKSQFLLLLPIILVVMLLPSCINVEDKTEINVYGNSMLWFSIDNSSMEYIESFEVIFTTKDVYGVEEERHIMYTKNGGFETEGKLSFPTTMEGGWQKVYEGLDETDSITIVYNGNKYTTRGYKFPEQRCIKINWKTTSVEGEFGIVDYDITIIEQEIEVSYLKQQDYESILLYHTLCYYDLGRNGANGNN